MKPIGFVSGEIHFEIQRTQKTIRIKLVKGVNLPSADPNGKSDPYVILELNNQKKKSKTIKKTLNPIFNENFEFEINKSISNNQKLNVTVYDYDFLVSDDFL